MSDQDSFWASINSGYNKQFCFKEYRYSDIVTSDKSKRAIAKYWFVSQCVKDIWGTRAQKVMKYWKKAHQDEVEAFVEVFEKMISRIIKERGMQPEEFGL